MKSQPIHLGIVGLGPKGLYGLERLLANLKHAGNLPPVHLHLFNETEHFATGWIYATNQPDYLLMNYPNRYISLNPESSPKPIVELPSFTEWRSRKTGKTPAEEAVLIAPRKEVGAYLKHHFEELCKQASGFIKLSRHITKVTGISKQENGFKIQTSDALVDALSFESILITTGHSTAICSKLQTETPRPGHIPFVYPFSETLEQIPPGTTVACKGMGLTALDTILGLTEGKGGRFIACKDDRLQYLKSGAEPARILPYSRSGIPMVPRDAQHPNTRPVSFYLKELVSRKLDEANPIHFETEVLPVIIQDLETEYYHKLFEYYGFESIPAHNWGEFQQMRQDFHKQHPDAPLFAAEHLWHPRLEPETDCHRAVAHYWEFWLAELKQKNSAYVAAASAWRFLSDDFNKLYSSGLFTPRSVKRIQHEYFNLFNRTAYGPPVLNIKKMLALMQAGILDFSYARFPECTPQAGVAISNACDSLDIDYSVDARIPRGFSRKCSLLFTTDPEIFGYKTQLTGQLHCTPEGHPLNDVGRAEPRIVLYGTPTEGRLFDNDTLSRKHNDTASNWARQAVVRLTATNLVTP